MSRKCIFRLAPMFAVLLSLYGLNVHAQSTATFTRYRLSVAEQNVALEVILPTISLSALRRDGAVLSAFVDPLEGFTNDGNAALLSALQLSKKHLPSLMIVVEPARQVLSPQDFRTLALKKLTKGAWDLKYLDHDGIPLARYTTDSAAVRLEAKYGISTIDAKLTDRNLEAFLSKEQVWARIRFTSASFGAEEEKLFYSIIESATFVDTSHPSNSFDYYSLGRALSARKEYLRAADNFTSALKLERTNRGLNGKQFYELIMKSAEAYAAISNVSTSAEVLEFGVTREPTNTTFLMQLARTYAVLRDTEKTLAILKTTFALMKQEKEIFEKTTFPGTTSHTMSLPDLNRDPAFKDMMKDKAFRDAVKALKK